VAYADQLTSPDTKPPNGWLQRKLHRRALCYKLPSRSFDFDGCTDDVSLSHDLRGHPVFSAAAAGTMTHRKPHLPEKICVACQRPFVWRKKWARDWEAVRYCSDRCRAGRGKTTSNAVGSTG
jgi:hypothetical protein